MKSGFVIFFIFAFASCFGQALSTTPPGRRQALKQTTTVQGFSCEKGDAWFYPDGHLSSCTLAVESTFGDARPPAGSVIRLTPDGKPLYLGLSFDTQIGEYLCEGGGALGASQVPAIVFYPDGRLKLCFLAGDQTVQGVPCMGAGGFLGAVFRHKHIPSVDFYPDGKLHSCTLSKNFGGQDRAELFVQSQ